MVTLTRINSITQLKIAGSLFISLAALLSILASQWTSLGAQSVDWLRACLGDAAVARLEEDLFDTQDSLQQWSYQTGLAQPKAPWQAPAADPERSLPAVTTTPATSLSTGNALTTPAALPAATPRSNWPPTPLTPLSQLEDEGQWTAYIQDPQATTVAYRTFLLPDPERPYAVTAIVAFDLQATRLHFVLGSDEPYSEVAVDRPGRIATEDFVPGHLLAVFNGGFKARHGQFGVMVAGTVVLPPKEGHGTLAFYADGQIRLGAWGSEIVPAPDLITWRQNGPLIIEHGQINPHTADNTPRDWGYTTVDNETATWRSAVGLSADGQRLYYAAGPKLTVGALAHALLAAGADQALQLDINNYWVHFDALQPAGDKLETVPLFDNMKNENDLRYLYGYTRDFFYVTLKP